MSKSNTAAAIIRSAMCRSRSQSRSTQNQSNPTPNALNQEAKIRTMSGVMDQGHYATTGAGQIKTRIPSTARTAATVTARVRVARVSGRVAVQFAEPERSCCT